MTETKNYLSSIYMENCSFSDGKNVSIDAFINQLKMAEQKAISDNGSNLSDKLKSSEINIFDSGSHAALLDEFSTEKENESEYTNEKEEIYLFDNVRCVSRLELMMETISHDDRISNTQKLYTDSQRNELAESQPEWYSEKFSDMRRCCFGSSNTKFMDVMPGDYKDTNIDLNGNMCVVIYDEGKDLADILKSKSSDIAEYTCEIVGSESNAHIFVTDEFDADGVFSDGNKGCVVTCFGIDDAKYDYIKSALSYAISDTLPSGSNPYIFEDMPLNHSRLENVKLAYDKQSQIELTKNAHIDTPAHDVQASVDNSLSPDCVDMTDKDTQFE